MVINHKSNVAVVVKQMRGIDAALLPAASKGLARGLMVTVGRAQTNYLQGPRPAKLGEKTGRLLRSITSRVRDVGDRVIGEVGTNVVYGARHEFGFTGEEQVSEHWRHQASRDLKSISKRGKEKLLASGLARVKSHTRRVNYAGRPFVRPALADTAPVIIEQIVKEIRKLSGNPPPLPS